MQAASSGPLFSRQRKGGQPAPVYPYVFDALAELQRATAYISDTKVRALIPYRHPCAMVGTFSLNHHRAVIIHEEDAKERIISLTRIL